MSYPDDPGPVNRRRRSASRGSMYGDLGDGWWALRCFLLFFIPAMAVLVSATFAFNWYWDWSASDAPRAAEDVTPVDLPAGDLQQPSALPTSAFGEGQDGADVAGEHSAPSTTPTPPSASEGTEVRERLDASQARSAGSGTDDLTIPLPAPYPASDEPWVISGAQWWALGLYASNSREWADDYAYVVFCESRNRVDAVGGPNTDGSYDHGGPQINDVHADRFDLDLVKRDPVYATESAWELWLDDEDWGPWEACRP